VSTAALAAGVHSWQMPFLVLLLAYSKVRVDRIGHARTVYVGTSQSCMV